MTATENNRYLPIHTTILRRAALALCTTALLITSARAQPPEPVPPAAAPAQAAPRIKVTEENLDALAIVGAFYRAMQTARTYRGQLTMTKTQTKDGKVVSRKVVQWNSNWRSDGQGNVHKNCAEGSFTTVTGDGPDAVTVTEKVIQLDDGKIRRSLDTIRNTWSEKQQPRDEPDMSGMISLGLWSMALMAFGLSDELTVTNRVSTAEPPRLIVAGANKHTELHFDKQSGTIRYWRLSSNDGETTEARWTALELNKPIPDSVYDWTPPPPRARCPRKRTHGSLSFKH